jgi:hypothetical protein
MAYAFSAGPRRELRYQRSHNLAKGGKKAGWPIIGLYFFATQKVSGDSRDRRHSRHGCHRRRLMARLAAYSENGRRHPTLLESDDLPTVMRNLSRRQLYFVRFDF